MNVLKNYDFFPEFKTVYKVISLLSSIIILVKFYFHQEAYSRDDFVVFSGIFTVPTKSLKCFQLLRTKQVDKSKNKKVSLYYSIFLGRKLNNDGNR